MSHPLSRVPFLGKFVDERFLEHRRRSTSAAGIAGAMVALAIFEYRILCLHVFDSSLFAILGSMAAVKLSMMIWFRFND